MDQLRELLATFANAQGVSGYEDDIAGLLQEHLADLTDEVRTDTMGNVIGTRNGDGPKIMIAAHMDEIGLMVKYIDDKGFLRFVPLGGWVDQILLGQRVVVQGREGNLYGVVGSRPPHIMEPDDRKKVIKLKDMFIDIGASSREEAEEFGVQIGSTITIDRDLRPLKGNLVTGKAFDDRAGMAMMVAAMRRLKDLEVRATVYAVGTVQEEVGLKGARTSAYGLDPDVALISEVTIPGDHPGVTKEERHVTIGGGPVLTVADSDGRGILVQRKVIDWLRGTADAKGISYQMDVGSGGTTDATAIHLVKTGVPSGVISVATRYIHSPIEVLSLEDLDRGAQLIAEAVMSAHEHL